ncbi:MAG: CBS domain-containing protein [Myxococcota bacterium]
MFPSVRCPLLTTALRDPTGQPRTVMEVVCPRHARPVPLAQAALCPVFERVSVDAHGGAVLVCRPGELGPLPTEADHPPSTHDTAEALLRPAVCIPPGSRPSEIEALLRDHGVHEALVVNREGRVLGVVGLMEVARAQMSGGGAWSDLARPLQVSVSPTTELTRISEVLHRTGRSWVAVLRDGLVQGAVWRQDLVRWMGCLTPARTLHDHPASGR